MNVHAKIKKKNYSIVYNNTIISIEIFENFFKKIKIKSYFFKVHIKKIQDCVSVLAADQHIEASIKRNQY